MLLSERTDNRNNNFDFLRFLAALQVLILHCIICFGEHVPWFVLCLDGVAVFFVISGFLVTRSWYDKPNIFLFLKKRILRIFPALILVVLFTALILGPLVTTLPLKEYFTDSTFFDYLKNIFLYEIHHVLPGVFETNPLNTSVNASLWTLPLEFFMYCLIAVFGFIKILNKKYFHLIFITFTILCFFVVAHTNIFVFKHNHNYGKLFDFLSLFFISSCFYIYRKKIVLSFTIFLICLVIFISGVAVTFKVHLVFEFFRFISLPYMVLYIAYSKIPYINNFGKYGDFSYGIYLWAFPVSQTLIYFWQSKFNLFTYIVSVFAITLFIAILSFKFIERPALKLKNKNFYKNLF